MVPIVPRTPPPHRPAPLVAILLSLSLSPFADPRSDSDRSDLNRTIALDRHAGVGDRS